VTYYHTRTDVHMLNIRHSCYTLNKHECCRQIKKKNLNINFRKNRASVSRVVPCGRTVMKKLTVAFRKFVNAPKKQCGDRM